MTDRIQQMPPIDPATFVVDRSRVAALLAQLLEELPDSDLALPNLRVLYDTVVVAGRTDRRFRALMASNPRCGPPTVRDGYAVQVMFHKGMLLACAREPRVALRRMATNLAYGGRDEPLRLNLLGVLRNPGVLGFAWVYPADGGARVVAVDLAGAPYYSVRVEGRPAQLREALVDADAKGIGESLRTIAHAVTDTATPRPQWAGTQQRGR